MLIDIQDGRPVGYITVNEYSKKYDVKEMTVRQWLRRGKINSFKIINGAKEFNFIPENEPLPYLLPTGVKRSGRKEKPEKMNNKPENYYAVDEFAKIIDANPMTVYQWCKRGRLSFYKMPGRNGKILISKDTVIPERTYFKYGEIWKAKVE